MPDNSYNYSAARFLKALVDPLCLSTRSFANELIGFLASSTSDMKSAACWPGLATSPPAMPCNRRRMMARCTTLTMRGNPPARLYGKRLHALTGYPENTRENLIRQTSSGTPPGKHPPANVLANLKTSPANLTRQTSHGKPPPGIPRQTHGETLGCPSGEQRWLP